MNKIEQSKNINQYDILFNKLVSLLKKYKEFNITHNSNNEYIIEWWGYTMRQHGDKLNVYISGKTGPVIEINMNTKTIFINRRITPKTQILLYLINDVIFPAGR